MDAANKNNNRPNLLAIRTIQNVPDVVDEANGLFAVSYGYARERLADCANRIYSMCSNRFLFVVVVVVVTAFHSASRRPFSIAPNDHFRLEYFERLFDGRDYAVDL